MNLKRLHNDLHEGALQLIAEHRVQLFAKAKSLCGNSSDADELVIRTIDRAIRKIDTYTGEGDILSWMMAILVNLHNHDHRNPVVRNTLAVEADELEKCAGEDWTTDEQILKDSDSEAIRKAISELDPKYNQVLMMRYYEEFSLRQIADILRLPLGTVCRRAQIAHRLLAGKLGAKLGKAKKPLAVLLAALFGIGALFGAWVSPLGDWVEEQVFGSVSEAEPTGETTVVQDVLTQTNDISIFVTEKQEGEDDVNIRTNFQKTVATAAVAAMGLTAAAGSGFDDYERLTYIESTGAQYIDTGIVSGPDVMMTVDFQLTALPADTKYTSRMRCGWAGVSDMFVFGCVPDRSDCFMASRCGKNDYHFTDIPVDLNRHTVFLGAGKQSVDGHVSAEESNYTAKGGSLYLFACHANYADGMNYMKMKLYGSMIEDGGTVHVYVPCKKKDGTAVGLYDLATDTFLGNQGTQGDFVAGPLAEGGLVVAGEPRCLGEVTPAYGYRAVTPGEDVACAASRNASDGVDAYACVGWCVYTNTSDSSGWVACEEGPGTSLNLRPYANTTTRLVWRWLRSVEQSPAQEPIADDAYCRVAYVGSASQEFKQYVDTKIGVGPDVALDVDFRLWKLPPGATVNDRFRCGWAGVDEQFNFGVIPDRTGYGDVFMASMSGKGANQFQFSGVKVDLLRHRVVIRSGEQKVDASVAATEANFVDPKVGNRGTLYLFATHTAYTAVGDIAAYMPMDVYACTITSGDDCHELIPCRRRADNVGGFYDTFTGEFLGLGSGWGSSGSLRVGEDCVTAESVLKVEGDPLAYGEVIPAYGHIGPLTPGQTIRCSAPLIPKENEAVSCAGYELYTNRSDDASAWILADSGTENAFDYVHPEGSGAKLVWKWSANGDLAVSHVSVTAQSSSSAGVSLQVESLGVGAKSADIVLEWGSSSNDLDRATVVRSAIAGAQVISTEVSGLPASRVCYARVRVTNDLGDAVRSEIFRIQLLPQGQLQNPSASLLVAADGYTLTASVDLDDACRAAADYVGLWYLFGDPLKPNPTENDLQERSSIAVAVDQEKISIPIPVGLTDGTGFWQFRAYNVADDGTRNFITRTLMDQVPIQDSSTYTWTGAGNTAAWSDAENWTGGVSGMWPFSTGAKVVFAAGSCGEVMVDKPVSIAEMDLSASGLDFVFRSDAVPRSVSVKALKLGLDTTDALVDSHLVFDAVKLEKTDVANVCIGNGSTVDLINGAELSLKGGNLRLRYDGGVANGPSGAAFLNVGAGCKLAVKNDVEFSGGSVITISNGTATVQSTFFNSTSGGGRYRMEGDSPSLKVEKTFRGSAIAAVTNCYGGIDFCIPEGGYASAPVVGLGTNEVAVLGGLDGVTAKPLVMTVVPESPILKVCPRSTDVPLVSWPGTINTNKVTFAKIRKGHGSVFFWGDQSAAPLSFGVRIVPNNGLVIFIR